MVFALTLSWAAHAKMTDREKLKEEIKQEVLEEIKKESGDTSWFSDHVKFSGQVRVRPEVRRNLTQGVPAVPGPREEDLSVLLRTRFGLLFTPINHIGFFIQGQDARDFGEEVFAQPNAVGDDEGLDLHQGYMEISKIADSSWNLRIGRQEIKFGNERLVGAVNWSNVGRSLDALLARLDTEKMQLNFLASTTDKTATNPGDAQYFGGIYGTWKKFPGGAMDGYYLLLEDNNGAAGAAAGTGDTLSVHTIGTRIKVRYNSGIDLGMESAVQLGKFGSNSILSFAEHVMAGYTWGPDWKPRLGIEYNFATGDDPASGRYTKFNNLFPTNHDKYGFMDMASWSNLHDGVLSFSIAPGKFFAGLDYHLFLVDKPTSVGDTFAGSAGAAGFGKIAGHEIDIVGKWTLNQYFDLLTGFSHFIPGAFFKDQGVNTSSDLFYLQAQAQFN